MELRARLFPLGDASQTVLERLLTPAEMVFDSARCPVSVLNPILPRILAAAEDTNGFWVSGEVLFTREELGTTTHFEPACRYVVPEAGGDHEVNRAAVDRAPALDAGSPEPIRLPRGLRLSRIAMKPNFVGSIGDWTSEFVAGSAAADRITQDRCTGVSLDPVMDRNGEAHGEYFQLFSDAVMAPAWLDVSVERIQSRVPLEHGKLSHLGCLAYPSAALRDRPDFNRTAEPWRGWFGQASWVVSSRVVSMFAQWKLRGWHFRPVLAAESDLYARYVEQWERLREMMTGITKSKFVGGLWSFLPAPQACGRSRQATEENLT